MSQNKLPEQKKSFSVDWLLRGTLTKLGDIFDRFTGRGWKPSSSIATSELIERLKKLLDSEAKDSDKKVKFVPHNIKLKMQWDKFSIDSEEAMQKLEHELLTAIIDHINDNRYHTYAPIKLEVKPDYFTEGVRLLASFDKFAEEESEAELNVTVPNLSLKNIVIAPPEEIVVEEEKEVFIAEFTVNDKPKKQELAFKNGQRLSIGRTKENALSIEDASVSKIHAAFVLNSEKQLMVADTGSTNGTFINGKRIAYGKAFPVLNGDKIKFGTVDVLMTYVPKEVEIEPEPEEVSVPASAVETQQMISEEEFSHSEDATIQADSSLVEIEEEQIEAEEKPFLPEATQKIPSKDASEGDSREDAPPLTEQGIVLDFGENK